MALGELSQALPTLPVPKDGGTVEIKRLPSDMYERRSKTRPQSAA